MAGLFLVRHKVKVSQQLDGLGMALGYFFMVRFRNQKPSGSWVEVCSQARETIRAGAGPLYQFRQHFKNNIDKLLYITFDYNNNWWLR